MASKKVIVPLKGTNVKKGGKFIKNAEGNVEEVAPDEVAGPGRPTKHDREAFAMKSVEIIQTIGAGPRDMGKVAVAYFDDEFVGHKEGEPVRVRKAFRDLGKRKVNSKQTQYAKLLEECGLEYLLLVEAAQRETPEGQLMYLAHAMAKEDEAQ